MVSRKDAKEQRSPRLVFFASFAPLRLCVKLASAIKYPHLVWCDLDSKLSYAALSGRNTHRQS